MPERPQFKIAHLLLATVAAAIVLAWIPQTEAGWWLLLLGGGPLAVFTAIGWITWRDGTGAWIGFVWGLAANVVFWLMVIGYVLLT